MRACYICDVCQEQYSDMIDAQMCENSHWRIDKEKLSEIYACVYNSDYDCVDSIVIPLIRDNGAETEHCKMKYVIDGFAQVNKEGE